MVAYTTIDHDVLLNETKGVAKVAQTFPKIKFAHKKGGESQDLRLLVAHYAKWANELFPSMAFTDFTKKVEELGQKRCVLLLSCGLRFTESIDQLLPTLS